MMMKENKPLPTIRVIFRHTIALSIGLAATSPVRAYLQTPSTAAPAESPTAGVAPDSEREAILAELAAMLNSPVTGGPEPLARMHAEASALFQLAERIQAFASKYPNDPARERLALARIEALYLASTIEGQGLEQVEAEVGRLLKGNPSPSIQRDIEYWRLRQRLNRVRAQQAVGTTPGASVTTLIGEYVSRHPEAPQSVSLIKTMIDELEAAGNTADIDRYLALLQKHHPDHAMTRTLLSRQRRRMAMNQPWRPALTGLDGRPLPEASESKGPTVVVFWSPSHEPSVRMLEIIETVRREAPQPTFDVLTIAFHHDAALAHKRLTALNVSGTVAYESRAWRCALAEQFGIRTLPTIFFVNQGLLRHTFEPRGWKVRADFEAALARAFAHPAPAPPLAPTTGPAASSDVNSTRPQ